MKNSLPILILSGIWGLSSFFTLAIYKLLVTKLGLSDMLVIPFLPIVFAFAFPIWAGVFSKFAHKGIIPGKFPREPMHPVYFLRRVYGLCWTQVYYFKPIYSVVLAIPFLKNIVLKLFGYKFSTNFITYPDTWIRDLTILKIGEGAYLSNKATIGTNICLSDGHIYVDKIQIQEKGLVGHLAMLAPGVKIYKGAEIGVGCAIGIKVHVKDGAKVGPTCTINHGTVIGVNSNVGTHSYVGVKAEIGDNIILPGGSNIPAGAVIKNNDDLKAYISSETNQLKDHLQNMSGLFANELKNVS